MDFTARQLHGLLSARIEHRRIVVALNPVSLRICAADSVFSSFISINEEALGIGKLLADASLQVSRIPISLDLDLGEGGFNLLEILRR